MSPDHFVYRLIPPRPTFAGDMSEAEKAIMGEHVAYWTKFIESGRVVVFGVVIEPADSWGLAVLEAASEEEVRAIGSDDPAVQTNLCTFEVGMMPMATVRPAQTAV